MELRAALKEKKRIVIKVGTSTVTYAKTGNINLEKLEKFVRVLINLRNRGKEIIVVSSGAVGIGKNVLGISEKPAGSVKQAYIIEENQKDIMLARKNKMTEPLIDRLLLNENRIRKMAEGLREIAALPDILGEIISMKTRPNGLQIGEKRVPLGVVGIIYEARPNVTADAFGLCFKTGNVAVLKGGSAAANSCRAIAEVIRGALAKKGMEPDALILVEDTSRESALEMMRMKDYLHAIISVKIVPAICDAVRHINKWNTGHSEAIITKDYANALYFQERVDAAAVYVNASTRFTDGNEFGFGAEIGISTQKLHARGPMGQEALTTKKYVIFGNGQIRG